MRFLSFGTHSFSRSASYHYSVPLLFRSTGIHSQLGPDPWTQNHFHTVKLNRKTKKFSTYYQKVNEAPCSFYSLIQSLFSFFIPIILKEKLWRCYSLVDEIHCLSFQLIRAVEVSQDENFCSILHGEVTAEGILTHDLQTLQGIL